MSRVAGPRVRRFVLLGGLLLALVVVPFVLWGAAVEAWTEGALRAEMRSWRAAVLLAALLASDVVLPVPSSVVSTAGGALFGAVGGTVISWAGMTAGCGLAWALGAAARRSVVDRIVGADRRVVETFYARHGWWVVVGLRAVPVLAEASVVVAGAGRMPFATFLVATAFANLGISATYAVIGARVGDATSFAVAFGAALALSGGAWIVGLRLRCR